MSAQPESPATVGSLDAAVAFLRQALRFRFWGSRGKRRRSKQGLGLRADFFSGLRADFFQGFGIQGRFWRLGGSGQSQLQLTNSAIITDGTPQPRNGGLLKGDRAGMRK